MRSRRARRRAAFSWAFLFGVLGLTAGVSAWKFGWLPFEETSASPDGLADAERPEENERPPAAEEFADGYDPFVAASEAGDSIPAQQEPTVGPARADTSDDWWEQQTASAAPQRLPAEIEAAPLPVVTSPREEPAFVETPSDSRVVQASAEQPAAVEAAPPLQELSKIDGLIQSGDYVNAHRELSTLYWNRPERRPQIQSRIEQTAKSLFFDPQPHYLEPYVVRPGDRLQAIAARYKLPWEYLAQLNRVKPERIRAGQRLKVNQGPFAAVVDLSDFEITIHAQGYYIHRYPVGIGKDNSTPLGTFQVQDKVVNPQYTDPDGRVFASDDPTNPIGERWLALGSGYGIHGTIEPDSIGRAESRGCIRLRHDDIVEVYDLLSLGSEVVIQR